MRIRRATIRDVAIVARHRVGMFRDMGRLPAAEEAGIRRGTVAWLRRAMPRGEFVGFLGVEKGEVVCGGGLLVRRMMPRPGHPRGFREAHVLNVFTEEGHRRRGHARALMTALLAWCRRSGFRRATLHASAKGKPLYLSLGFRIVEEFRYDVPGPGRLRAR